MKKFAKFLTFSMVLVQGCTKNQQVTTSTTKTLRCVLSSDLTTFDPGRGGDSYTSSVLSQCFESLMQLDEKGKAIPNLAEKVETSKDGKIYTFNLKKGVKFHNGDELTAQDFKWTFERNLSKKLNSPTALNFLRDIEGAREYSEGKTTEVKGIKAIDRYTLELHLEQPRGYFLQKLTYIVTSALNHKVAPKTLITQKEDVIGTGPFQFSDYRKNSYCLLNANLNYHNDKPTLSSVEYFIINDSSNAILINKIKKNELDFCEINIAEVKSIQQDPNLKDQIVEVADGAFSYLEFNSNLLPILKDPKFRLAIAHAINQEEMVKEALNGNAIPSHYLIPQGIIGYRFGTGNIKFDVGRAKELLQEAKIDPKKISIPITVASKSTMAKKVAENLSVQLRKNLGLSVTVQSLSWGTYLAKAEKKQIPIRYASWGLDYPDPSNVITFLFDSRSSQNYCNFNNSIFDSLARKADSTINPQERITFYQQAEDILLQEGIVIPLYVGKRYWWINKNVKGIRYTIRGHMPHNKVIKYA